MKNNRGFSMVEMMITVVIVAVCLIVALRGFSVCATSVSRAYDTTYAADILENKMDLLREKAIVENGLFPGSSREDLTFRGKKFTVSCDITEVEVLEESFVEEEMLLEQGAPEVVLVNVVVKAVWGRSPGEKKMTVETFLPGKEAEYEV
ncbi:MAG: prepilin-type N-terminal cleavage/methylation domain-containing protein [Candidatus Omnitrophica bacterium]|nr:prepilin-type N-terminal cleavage/methylation domain-containing protein [Candidatus Omnitrophota bacterium]